jgi:membrane protein DedA with SNARE-associated domain
MRPLRWSRSVAALLNYITLRRKTSQFIFSSVKAFEPEGTMLTETIFRWVTEYGYIGIFSLLALGILGAPIPDEGVLAFAGFLVYEGKLQLFPILAAAFLGSACGITLSYGLGRTVGVYLVSKFGHTVYITGDKVTHVHTWYDHVGKWGLLFGVYLPGVRHLIGFGAGIAKLPVTVFARFAFTGAFIWSVTFVSAGYFLGRQWTLVFGKIRPTLMTSSIVIVGLFLLCIVGQQLLRQRK